MKLFRDIKKWFDNQEHLFYLFLVILIVPNVVLCFTEPISWTAKICNILLPLSIYYAVMAWSRNCGRTFWLLFPFIFFGAFQLVLLYLFGQSIIAVDMFLNLVTTNSSEALELLDNLIPAIVIALYTCINSGNHIHCTQTQTVRSIHPASSPSHSVCAVCRNIILRQCLFDR